MTEEKFLSATDLVSRLNEYGVKCTRASIQRWMHLERPMPHHRPGGGGANIIFLWSEVYAWLKTAWFEQTPDQTNGAA